VLQRVTDSIHIRCVCCSDTFVLHDVAVRRSALQCVAVRCSLLQCVADCNHSRCVFHTHITTNTAVYIYNSFYIYN